MFFSVHILVTEAERETSHILKRIFRYLCPPPYPITSVALIDDFGLLEEKTNVTFVSFCVWFVEIFV